MQPLFDINALDCGYSEGGVVLRVPKLQLPQRKLIFVVGVSGGGKSTLLETLGMMNRTIIRSDSVNFTCGQDANVNISLLWNRPSEQLDAFRKRNYSFIFQKTNLIPNFTCGENMMLPALFKGGIYDITKERVLDYMEKLDLSHDLFDKHIMDVSGGQRQRLAFIRAIVSDFTVLFGDEPTGNLDKKNASDVMTLLNNYLKENQRSGIVVSHDLDLAKTFADIIVPILKVNDESSGSEYGYIFEGKVLYRQPSGSFKDSTKTYDNISAHLKLLTD